MKPKDLHWPCGRCLIQLFKRPEMTDQDRLDTMRWMHQGWAQHIARLTPQQAVQLAQHDMQVHSALTKQFERTYLAEEMSKRACAHPDYKAAIDQAAMARVVAALQQSRASETPSAVDVAETCS